MNYEQEIEQIEKDIRCPIHPRFMRTLALTKKMQEHIKDLKMLMVCYQVNQKEEWIPCSERLPEEEICFWVTINYRGEAIAYIVRFLKNKIINGKWIEEGEEGEGEEVIAWLPLPQPFGGDV